MSPACNTTSYFFSRSCPKELEALNIIVIEFGQISRFQIFLENGILSDINVSLAQLDRLGHC